jgi:hypothetical protein
MSHHGNHVDAQLNETMRKLFGEFPDGKLNPDDSGAVALAVGVEDGRVVLRFPKPVAWVGLTGDEAFELAQCLLRHSRNAGITSPIVIRVGG